MTLLLALVTPDGVWSSTDHRLTAWPRGEVISDSSVKHVILRCRDGAALVTYTGLGRVGRLDVSTWMREVLRGESRTVDESLIDLREQATARIGSYANSIGIQHAFVAGAFLQGQPWAVEIRNVTPPSAVSKGGVQPRFDTVALKVDKPLLMAAGAGRDAVRPEDRELLMRVRDRRPRKPEEFMQLLGDVNQRAAESRRPGAASISRACTVLFMPPSGDGVKSGWYGPDDERHLAPQGFSHLLFGIDLHPVSHAMATHSRALFDGRIDDTEFGRRTEEAARSSVEPRGRRSVRHLLGE